MPRAPVKNEPWKDQRPGIRKEGHGSEYQVRQREDDEDLEMPASGIATKHQNG
jgi:hypothetical protein